MAKISVSIPDDLAEELRDEAIGNVSRFVSSAVRDALDRRRLMRALEALDAELGPVDPELLDEADAAFAAIEAANEKRTAQIVRSRAGRIGAGGRKVTSSKKLEPAKRSR